MSSGTDVIVVGAGCMGAAVAAHLVRVDGAPSVKVLDSDLSLERSSTLRSDGNVRIQFNLRENIAMSLYGMEVLDRFGDEMEVDGHRPHVELKRQGNLFLADADSEEEARPGLELQQDMGCDVVWLDQTQIAARWSPLVGDRIVGGTFGRDDGSVDPTAVTTGYRRVATTGGAVFEQAEVVALEVDGDRIRGVRLASAEVLEADVVVVCAGAWSTELLATASVEIPVAPIMRTVYVVATDVGRGMEMPSAFLPSGVYLIPEAPGRYLMAWSLPDDPVGYDFTPARRDHFYGTVWPELVAWLPSFDRLEVVGSWAGLYAQNTLDANAILGEWPTVSGLYQATGFSGHGFQHCHAVGRYLAESITGAPPFLDLSRFGPQRVLAGHPLHELAGRII